MLTFNVNSVFPATTNETVFVTAFACFCCRCISTKRSFWQIKRNYSARRISYVRFKFMLNEKRTKSSCVDKTQTDDQCRRTHCSHCICGALFCVCCCRNNFFNFPPTPLTGQSFPLSPQSVRHSTLWTMQSTGLSYLVNIISALSQAKLWRLSLCILSSDCS